MKYLLGFLENLSDGPSLTDPEFQQLLVNVQAGKSQPKSADAFYDSLEKVVNELRSTPESLPFQKPVARREAPDYYDVIKRPMDLSSMLRNVKQRKYRNKAEFAADLSLIWENCYTYNFEGHPIRVQARFMQQKADHHLEFLADRNDQNASSILPLLPMAVPSDSSAPSRQLTAAPTRLVTSRRGSSQAPAAATGEDEDAAGESEDEQGDQSFRHEAGAGPQSHTAAQTQEGQGGAASTQGQSSRGDQREGSASATGSRGVTGVQPNGIGRGSSPFRAKLQNTLDTSTPLIRTAQSMSYPTSFSLGVPGPSTLEKGKAKDTSACLAAPSWYPSLPVTETGQEGEDDSLAEGSWWGSLSREDAYVSGMPVAPAMRPVESSPKRTMGKRKRRRLSTGENGLDIPHPSNGRIKANGHSPHSPGTPSRAYAKPENKLVNLQRRVEKNVDKLFEARKVMGQILDWQRLETEGAPLPRPFNFNDPVEKEKRRIAKAKRKASARTEIQGKKQRRKSGGEVGEAEAAISIKKATAGMLAHAGFEGANETALDLMTRIASDHIRSLGRMFRLFLDDFSHDLSAEQIILHVLHENGQLQPQDLEAHIKDEIEREGVKITEMTKKVRQAYMDVTTAPVIEDDMMFNDNGEMFVDGNFADELGEDFLGLREMGIDREFGLSSLTVPSSLFYGRRKRTANANLGEKNAEPDYPPPPPFIPLTSSAISNLPALLHAFYAARLEAGLSISEDEPFDHTHSQMGPLGQITVKLPPAKKKKDDEAEAARKVEEKKPKAKKPSVQGVGKGNWIRPPKEERDRRAAEKKAALERMHRTQNASGTTMVSGGINGDVSMGEEDAQGEVEVD